jgi:tetratricopeptide (TPR) repeat protein
MAYFTARDEKPVQYCQSQVRHCDVYVGLIGMRYGSPVRDRPEVSYTELEFDTATASGCLCLVFLLDEEVAAPIPPGQLFDADADLQARQRAFRARMRDSGRMTGKFASPEQLELLLVQALQESRPQAGAPAQDVPATQLPTRPQLVGRDAEVTALVRAWLATPPEPVAVLGAPGVGKSTICLAALHDDRVAARFADRRWFIRCDGATSAGAMLSRLAAGLGLTGNGATGDITGQVCAVLGAGLSVVVLDNFETPWTADPLEVEELLRRLAAIPQVGVALSSRGTARPAGLRWRDFAMVSPLPLADARQLFLAISEGDLAADPQLDNLLDELDGMPLAVELLAYAAQGQPDLTEVAQRWRAERTGMLARMGGTTRDLSVAVSLEASITSPLMSRPARRLLGLLGVLPDGIARDHLTELLPTRGLAGAAVLRQLGLAFGEGHRLRTLAPIREHIAAAQPPEPTDLDQAISHYAHLAATGNQVGRSGGAQTAARLRAETGNIAAMLEQAAAAKRIDELTEGLHGLVHYGRHTGFTHPALISTAERAIQAHGTTVQQARTWEVLGYLALSRSDQDTAHAHYQKALTLYRQAGNLLGEANCIKGLADTTLHRSDQDTAHAHYQKALTLYRQAGNLLGEASCLRGLGDIALERSDQNTARTYYQEALPLYQAIAAPYCIGWTLIRLARLERAGSRERADHRQAAFEAWSSIGREDLIQSVRDEIE